MKVEVNRKTWFNAAHRLHNPNWSEEKNKEVFGLCNNAHYHGHNYEMIVSVRGEIDPDTGYVVDMKWLKDLVEEHVVSQWDHKNLNMDVPEFKELIPSAENIAVVAWQKLRPHLAAEMQLRITLFETERNFVVYDGN